MSEMIGDYGVAPEMAALMRKPTVGAATVFYETFRKANGLPYPKDATPEVTALACVHKARLGWAGSSEKMVRESKAWLVEHGMSPTLTLYFHGSSQ